MSLLHRLIEMLEAKADTISRGRRGSSDEFAQHEVASFWLLHTIHASAADASSPAAGEARASRAAVRRAGATRRRALHLLARRAPAYAYRRTITIAPKPASTRSSATSARTSRSSRPRARSAIPLVSRRRRLSTSRTIRIRAASADARGSSACESSLPAHELAAHFPQLAKVCSSKFVLELVTSRVPGSDARRTCPTRRRRSRRAPTCSTSRSSAPVRAGTRSSSTQEIGVYVPERSRSELERRRIELERSVMTIIVDGSDRESTQPSLHQTCVARRDATRTPRARAAGAADHRRAAAREQTGRRRRRVVSHAHQAGARRGRAGRDEPRATSGDDVRFALFAVIAFLDETVLNSGQPMFAQLAAAHAAAGSVRRSHGRRAVLSVSAAAAWRGTTRPTSPTCSRSTSSAC